MCCGIAIEIKIYNLYSLFMRLYISIVIQKDLSSKAIGSSFKENVFTRSTQVSSETRCAPGG